MPSAGPSRIYLIRHAEKVGLADVPDDAADPNHPNTGPDLSVKGSARAAALPSLFVPMAKDLTAILNPSAGGFSITYERIGFAGMGPRFVPPQVVLATKPSKHSNRPLATATPTAASLGLTVEAKYKADEYAALAEEVLQHGRFAGKAVLICWHHGKLPDLAHALGATDAPDKWDGTVFDRLWLLDYKTDPPGFTDCPQCLLFGDSSS